MVDIRKEHDGNLTQDSQEYTNMLALKRASQVKGRSMHSTSAACGLPPRTSSNPPLAAALSIGIRVPALGLQADAGSLSWSRMSGPGLVQRQLLGDGCEQFPHVLGGLCGGLEEEKACLLGVRFSIGGGNGALVGLLADEIELVSCKGNDDVLVGLALELLDPRLRLVQRGLRLLVFPSMEGARIVQIV